jgi:hypothetical protein
MSVATFKTAATLKPTPVGRRSFAQKAETARKCRQKHPVNRRGADLIWRIGRPAQMKPPPEVKTDATGAKIQSA